MDPGSVMKNIYYSVKTLIQNTAHQPNSKPDQFGPNLKWIDPIYVTKHPPRGSEKE